MTSSNPWLTPTSTVSPSHTHLWPPRGSVALHSPFLYLDLPLLCHPPSDWLRLFSGQNFFHINTPIFSTPVILHTYPPMKMEQTLCSEMLAYKFRHRGITQKKAYNFLIFLPTYNCCIICINHVCISGYAVKLLAEIVRCFNISSFNL